MIGLLSGKVLQINMTSITIDVHEIGYEVFCPQSLITKLNLHQQITLHIHTHVREDQFTLFGFLTQLDRDLFRLLITVSGVGPKIALTLLSHHSQQEIKNAISLADTVIFTHTPGIGKRVAQKIIVDLKSKIGSLSELDLTEIDQNSELISALESLGYKSHELQHLIKKIPNNLTSVESQIKYVLKNL